MFFIFGIGVGQRLGIWNTWRFSNTVLAAGEYYQEHKIQK